MEDNKKESMDDYMAELESSFRSIKEGDILKGTIIDVTEEGVTLDLKYYTQGIIHAGDLSNDPTFSILDEMTPGDEIDAAVIRMDDGQGNILLSRKAADDILAWDRLKELQDKEAILTVKIAGIVNSGVVAYVEGVRGFIPASQLSMEYVEDCNDWLHRTLEVQIITLDPQKKKLVLSGKAVEKARAEAALAHKIAMLIPGSIVEGTVETIMPYGAFINIGDGLSGLVHISQICQRRIASPNEVLKAGEKVKAKILNTNDGRISLSMKALEEVMPREETEEREAIEYSDGTAASTSLANLLKNIKL